MFQLVCRQMEILLLFYIFNIQCSLESLALSLAPGQSLQSPEELQLAPEQPGGQVTYRARGGPTSLYHPKI